MTLLADAASPTVLEFMWMWINGAADVVSILSFLLTIYVVVAIRKYHHRFERLAVLPQLNRRLRHCLASIKSARERKNEDDMQSGLSRFRAILVQIRSLTMKETRGEIDRSIGDLDEFSRAGNDVLSPRMNALIGKLHGTVESCVDFEARIPWRHPDDG